MQDISPKIATENEPRTAAARRIPWVPIPGPVDALAKSQGQARPSATRGVLVRFDNHADMIASKQLLACLWWLHPVHFSH